LSQKCKITNRRRYGEEIRNRNGYAAWLPLSMRPRVAAAKRSKTKGLPEVQKRELGPTEESANEANEVT
jgi:hypothetical protein